MDNYGHIMSLYMYKTLFSMAAIEQLAATRDKIQQTKNVQLNTITQWRICRVKIEHNNKWKVCKFFVDSWNGQALLDMPDFEILNIQSINCNKIGTGTVDPVNDILKHFKKHSRICDN